MKIIHNYSGGLKKYTLDGNDRERFIELLTHRLYGDTSIIDRLVKYLSDNKKEVTVSDTYDPQSGWRGFNFYFEGVDISGNGYCFDLKLLSEMLTKKGF